VCCVLVRVVGEESVYGGCDKNTGIVRDVLLALEAGGVVRNLPRLRKADGGGLASSNASIIETQATARLTVIQLARLRIP
jgi:hypothetical protein